MKHPSPYLKMRVLGAIDNAEGKTIRERIQKTADLLFTDEEGNPRRFTWRTISTWYYSYKNYGITGVQATSRSDKGKTRKISPEELLEAINQVLPHFVPGRYNKFDIYRMCIEKGILHGFSWSGFPLINSYPPHSTLIIYNIYNLQYQTYKILSYIYSQSRLGV